MVQDKKNFSSVKRNMDETKDLDRKGQAQSSTRSADSKSQSSSAGIKGQTNLSKDRTDKADISKRDVSSRK
ncbi:MAG: hypothetical protein K2Q18_00865 [Bdellovibrionales bacterium]|nr:hypothetical protein [Bdellovibrionales bacterium]